MPIEIEGSNFNKYSTAFPQNQISAVLAAFCKRAVERIIHGCARRRFRVRALDLENPAVEVIAFKTPRARALKNQPEPEPGPGVGGKNAFGPGLARGAHFLEKFCPAFFKLGNAGLGLEKRPVLRG